MATPYSLDLRERIMKDYDGGYPIGLKTASRCLHFFLFMVH